MWLGKYQKLAFGVLPFIILSECQQLPKTLALFPWATYSYFVPIFPLNTSATPYLEKKEVVVVQVANRMFGEALPDGSIGRS